MEWLILNVLVVVVFIAIQLDEGPTLCQNPNCGRRVKDGFCSDECRLYVEIENLSEDELKTRRLFQKNKEKLGF